MKALTLPDMGFLYCETVARPNHVAALQIFDIPENYPGDFGRDLYESMMKHTNVEPPFNHKLHTAYTGLMYWVEDEEVDLSYHVRYSMLPKPGSRQQIIDYAEHAHSNLLDRSRPLWEVHIICGLEDNKIAFYMKMHHAFTDGARANKMLSSYLTPRISDQLLPMWAIKNFEKAKPETKKGLLTKVTQRSATLRKQVSALPSILGLGSRLLLQGAKVYKTNIPTPFTAPKTPFSISPKRARRVSTADLPLKRIKNISKMSGTTINDVVVCVCDIALHHYLADRNYKLKQPLLAQIPVSLREEGDTESNNRIAITMVELAFSEANPLTRLMAIKESCDKLKQEAKALSDEALTSYTLASQGLAIVSEMLNLDTVLPPVGNVLISNVPGPRKPYYMMGSKMESCYPLSALPPGMSLNITLYSYADHINVGLVACRSNLPDLSKISGYIEDAYEELEQVVMNSAIDIVSEQIQLLKNDAELSKSMYNVIDALNEQACSTLQLTTTETSTASETVSANDSEVKTVKTVASKEKVTPEKKRRSTTQSSSTQRKTTKRKKAVATESEST